jgi:SAM-dependent methyltransferase
MVADMWARERGRVFGEVADEYDGVRPGYPDSLVDTVLAYAGTPRRIVEVGAGTGKATAAFAARSGPGVPIHCVEPDPRMAMVLRDRLANHPQVEVEVSRFEDWRPPAGGADLLYCAQAWHWVDTETRWQRALATLAPGGTIAIFGHSYDVIDPEIETAMWEIHARLRPDSSTLAPPGPVDPDRTWFAVELAGSGLFTEARADVFHHVVSYPATVYLALVHTFSAYRMLVPAQRQEMRSAMGQLIDAHGGTVEIDLATVLALGHRQS